jgi:hypothetical protein
VEGLETTIRDTTLQNVTANVTFTSADKTEALSNNLRVNLNLGEEGTAASTTGEQVVGTEESETEQAPAEQEEENGEDRGGGEEQELPLPLFDGSSGG